LGVIVRSDNNSPEIGSVNGTTSVLPVKLGSMVAGAPSVTDIMKTSATFTSTGHFLLNVSDFVSGGFQYSTSPDMDDATNVLWGIDTFDPNPITRSVSALKADTQYYLRTYLTTKTDTYYSAVIPFTTEEDTVATTTLTISNAVSGEFADKTKEFSYTATFKDSNDTALAGPLAYTNASGELDSLTLIDGSATFTLKDGESVVIDGVPENGKVQVVQTGDLLYTASYTDIEGEVIDTGSAAAGQDLTPGEQTVTTDRSVSFINTRTTVVASAVDANDALSPLVAVAFVLLASLYLIRRVSRRRAAR
jgi:fibronectin-binding protein 1